MTIAERKILERRVRDAIAAGYDVAYQGSIVIMPEIAADERASA